MYSGHTGLRFEGVLWDGMSGHIIRVLDDELCSQQLCESSLGVSPFPHIQIATVLQVEYLTILPSYSQKLRE